MSTLQAIRRYKHSVRQYSIFLWAIALFFGGAIPYWIATLHALCATIDFKIVEMDKIVSKKRGWVTPASTQPTKNGDRTNGEQQSHLFLLY